jgi:hypothetical protein
VDFGIGLLRRLRFATLQRRFATVSRERRARAKRGLVGRNKYDHLRNLLGPPDALERNSRSHASLSFRTAGESVQHGRFYRSGRDPVDAHAELRRLECRGFRQSFYCVLARGVDRRARCAFVPEGGRHVDDAAVFLILHHVQLMLHAQERAEDIGVEGSRVALGGLLRDWTGLTFGTRVIDRHIEAAKARHSLIDQTAHVVVVTHVGTPIFCLRAKGAEFCDQFFAGVVATTGDDDVCTFLGEGQGGGSSDAREGTSDQNNRGVHEKLLQFIFLLARGFSQPAFLHPLG